MMIVPLIMLMSHASSSANVVPLPQSIHWATGELRLSAPAEISTDPELEGLKSFLPPSLSQSYSQEGSVKVIVSLKTDGSLKGYRLEVTDDGIEIRGRDPESVFHGIQTLRQLEGEGGRFPFVRIADHPRFTWRGCHVDVARRFMPLPWLYKLIDELAKHKLNVLHLHLTDDQGWRLEIKQYPLLTEVGSKREDSQTNDAPDQFEGRPHEGYYTQKQMRELAVYASARFVTILPEIEMPGHSQAAIASYPELGNTGERVKVSTGWGIHHNILNVKDSTIQFYKNVLDEVIEVFPSKFIHVGGDEAPKKQWKESPEAQAKMRELGLKDEEELQSWFIRQMDAHLASRGRRLVGWDEILEGGLAPGATVMSWTGVHGGIAAAKAGHDVVMSPYSWAYLDQSQSDENRAQNWRTWGNLTLRRCYRWDPMPEGLTPEQQKHVLGAQAGIWTEALPSEKEVSYHLFPRLCALSEVFWLDPEKMNYEDFRRRLKVHLGRLKLPHHPLEKEDWPVLHTWSKGDFASGALAIDAASVVAKESILRLKFDYFDGDSGLTILGVELSDSQGLLADDPHAGFSGGRRREVFYTLRLLRAPVGKVTLVIKGRSEGGDPTFGDILYAVEPIKALAGSGRP